MILWYITVLSKLLQNIQELLVNRNIIQYVNYFMPAKMEENVPYIE